MKVFVVLYQDLWLKTSKVSQEGYRTLEQAQQYCKVALGMDSHPNNPAFYQGGANNQYVFGNSVTKQRLTIVEVTV